MGEIVCIANQKGGVGKTTTAVNLSYALACLGQEVLLVDFDPQGNATSGLGIEVKDDDKTVYNFLTKTASFKEVVRQTSNEMLDILPSNKDLAGAEVELVNINGREKFLKEQDCEVNLPGVLNFLLFKIDNRIDDCNLYGGHKIKKFVCQKESRK